MEIGDRVRYKNKYYWVVGRLFQGLVEIAPTVSGIGGFMVHSDTVSLRPSKNPGPEPGWPMDCVV